MPRTGPGAAALPRLALRRRHAFRSRAEGLNPWRAVIEQVARQRSARRAPGQAQNDDLQRERGDNERSGAVLSASLCPWGLPRCWGLPQQRGAGGAAAICRGHVRQQPVPEAAAPRVDGSANASSAMLVALTRRPGAGASFVMRAASRPCTQSAGRGPQGWIGACPSPGKFACDNAGPPALRISAVAVWRHPDVPALLVQDPYPAPVATAH